MERQEDTKISSEHNKSNLETPQKQDHVGETLEFDGREENWLNSPGKHSLLEKDMSPKISPVPSRLPIYLYIHVYVCVYVHIHTYRSHTYIYI